MSIDNSSVLKYRCINAFSENIRIAIGKIMVSIYIKLLGHGMPCAYRTIQCVIVVFINTLTFHYHSVNVTAQADLLLTGGGSGVAAKPPHHSPLLPRTLSSYQLTLIRQSLLTWRLVNIAYQNTAMGIWRYKKFTFLIINSSLFNGI